MNVLVMNCVRRSLFLLSLAGLLSASLFGGSDDYVSGMKTRLPKVLVAKDAGTIGEGTDGLLHSREGGSVETQALVAAENKDRKALFNALSAKTGGSVEEVVLKFSNALAKKAKKGHWFKKANGTWIQK